MDQQKIILFDEHKLWTQYLDEIKTRNILVIDELDKFKTVITTKENIDWLISNVKMYPTPPEFFESRATSMC